MFGKVPAKKGSNGIFTGQTRDGENINTNCMAGSWDCFDHCQQFLNHSKSMKWDTASMHMYYCMHWGLLNLIESY